MHPIAYNPNNTQWISEDYREAIDLGIYWIRERL